MSKGSHMKSIKRVTLACFWVMINFFSICAARPCIKVFFPGVSPLLPKILELINGEKKQIAFAQYALLHPEVVSALSFAAKRGVKVSGIIDQNSIEHISKHILLKDKHARNSSDLLTFLRKCNISIYANHGRVMHNKIMCFASNSQARGPIVVTGSANCTISGLNGVLDNAGQKDCSHNFENMLVIQGYKKIYDQYRQEICKMQMEAKRRQDKRHERK